MKTNLITLGQIRDAGPCTSGWRKLLEKTGQNPTNVDFDLNLSIGDIAHANGAADACWALRFVRDRRAVMRAILPTAKRAANRTADKRVHDCIAAIDRWIAGESVDLRAAAAAAWAAARAADAREDERQRQVADIITVFPLHFFAAIKS